MSDQRPLHPVIRTHLETMTDEVGIMQHAVGSTPDPAHGYCTDDVSRALQVDLLHASVLGWPAIAASAWRSLRFLVEAFDAGAGRFRNFRAVGGAWLDASGSEDCQGRAMHALGDAMASAPDETFAATAAALFERALPAMLSLRALRAVASVTLGCEASLRAGSMGRASLTLEVLASRLHGAFDGREGSVWPWPESRVTYENGLPVRALIVAGSYLGTPRMVATGLGALDWLVAAQTADEGHLSLIGNGWWAADGIKSRFDQQPMEATALLLAAEAAYQATGDGRWKVEMERAYGWFLGENDLGIEVAEPGRGASFDGLTAGGVNRNQGAESTLMWLVALEHVRAIRPTELAPDEPATLRVPVGAA